MSGVAGFNCVLTIGGNVVGKARDVELTGTAGAIDVTVRDSAGWKEFIQGLKEWGITVEELWVPSNTALQAIRDAWLNGSVVSVEIEDDTGNGFSGDAIVTDIGVPQPLDGAVTMPSTLKGTGALTVLVGS